MKLLITPTSPYARKARIVALEKNLPVEFAVADPWPDFCGVADINPLNKIPVLIPDGGEPIFDSRVIVEYLDAQAEAPRLIPADPAARARVKTMEALADGITDAAASVLMAGRVAGAEAVPQKWREWQTDKIRRAVAYCNAGIQKRPAAEALHLGDIALGCALGFLDFRFPDLNWREANPALAEWFAPIANRPSFAQTAPKAP